MSSIITRWAVFSPIPLTDCMVPTLLAAMASLNSSGDNDESMVLAVLAPIPETEISNLKIARSETSIKP